MEEQIKKYRWTIAVFLILGAFYWFEWRPSQVVKNCSRVCDLIAGEACEDRYQDCLYSNGIDRSFDF